ncbi:MAG: chain length-determining protein [Burkholderiales bacterium]|nr:chain length-determining protein [Burkholderiales bacterium]
MESAVSQAITAIKGTWRRRWIGLVVAWIVGVGGAVMIFLTPDRYEASARIFVDTQTMLRPLLSGLAVQPDINEQVMMLSRTLISRPNVERLIRMTDLDLKLKSPKEREEMIDRLVRTLQIRMSGGDNLYNLTYQDRSPEEAKKVVQALLSIFVESGLGAKRQDTDQAKRFIEDQIASYETKLVEAENRLKEFRLKNMGRAGSDGRDHFGQMTQMAEMIETARLELRSAEQSRDVLKRELAGEDPVFIPDDVTEAVQVDEAVPEIDVRIAAQKSKLDELLRVFTDAHPDVIGTRRILDQLEEQKKQELAARKRPVSSAGKPRQRSIDRNPVYQQIKISLSESEALVASLRARLAEYERRYETLRSSARLVPEVEAEYAQLNRDYEVQKRNYETLVSRRESATISEKMEESAGSVDFRVVDPPRVSSKPVAPNRLLLLSLALVAAIGAGVAVSFGIGQLFPVFFDTRSLYTHAERPVLGAVSQIRSPVVLKRKRHQTYAFVGGFGMLLVAYGGMFGMLLVFSN